MKYTELKNPEDITIKFIKLKFPSSNVSIFPYPLSGLYNPIDNKQSENYKLSNLFKNFCIPSSKCVNLENLFMIDDSSKISYINDKLTALLCFKNSSYHEITLKNIDIRLKDMDKKTQDLNQIILQVDDKNMPLLPGEIKTIKIEKEFKVASNYYISIKYHTLSKEYDNAYYKVLQKNLIKEDRNYYQLINGSIEYKYKKMFDLKIYNPFAIHHKFYNLNPNELLL